MKAIVQHAYGSPDVFKLKDVAMPAAGDNDVLVRVQAAALHAGDIFTMRGDPYLVRMSAGWPQPKGYIPGFDVAGYVEAVGSRVTRFQPGDAVFGACTGTCAEYACAEEKYFFPKPTRLSLEQAASIPTSAATALRCLRDAGKLQPGFKVLINGASGGVGTFAVQIAKALGAEVTGVCSATKVDLVRSIGADHVVDYTREDFTRSGQRYDLILDQAANFPLAACRRALTPQGLHIPNSGLGGLGYVLKAFLLSLVWRQQGRPIIVIPNHADLAALDELIEAGKLVPVIDRTYALAETPEAFRYLDDGHARGKVVIRVRTNAQA